MLTMADINNIRFQFYHEGLNISEISQKTGHDHKTIRKYLDLEDFNLKPPSISSRCTKLEPFMALIDSWLEADKKAKRKQRHTATRVFERLTRECEGFDCSYRTVANYFKTRRKELYKAGGFLPLEHIPGEAQVDFGKTEYIENGKRFNGSHFVLSFPSSNAGYALLFPGESAECLFEGMKMIFERIGGVPSRIWFDNPSSLIIKVLQDGERKQTESFLRFKNHYGFDAVFCNPGSGHEKGNVENKVGYTRRNMFVPIPEFRNLEEFNQAQLARCEEDFQRSHYKHGKLIAELFENDKAALLTLPATPFEVCKYVTAKANLYGKVTIDKKTYSTTPTMAGSVVRLKQTALKVFVLDSEMNIIVEHPRLYGKEPEESMRWLPYLKTLAQRPRALKYIPIYSMFPENLQNYLSGLRKSECGKVLKTISALTERSNFSKAVEAVGQTIERGVVDSDSIVTTFNRILSSEIELPDLKVGHSVPAMPETSFQGDQYDDLMTGGVH